MVLPTDRRSQQLQRAVIETLEARRLLSGNGLLASYFNTADLTGTAIVRNDASINFNWGNGAPDNQLNPDGYSARWTGKVQAAYSQTYTFSLNVTGGARLWVNNVQIINQWSATGTNTFTGTIALNASTKYDIKLEYAEKTGNAAVALSWSSASQAQQIIPQSALYSFVEADASAKSNGSSSYNTTTGALTIQGGNKTQDWMIPYYFSVQGHLVYQQLSGDAEIIARVTARDANAFAGIFIADNLSWGANSINLAFQNNGNLYSSLIGSPGSNSHGNVGTPYWLKLVRLGNTFTAYASADGNAWTVVGYGGDISMGSTVYIGLGVAGNDSTSTGLVSATFDNISIRSLKLDYTTSWVGNSDEGVSAKHVQNDIKSMFVASDGTVFVNSPYDEGGYEAAAYRNGEILGGFTDLHGWGRSGGFAITADANYVYIAMTQGNAGWTDANFPPIGSNWNCIRRYSRSTFQPVAFTGGSGSDKSMLIVNTDGGAVRGMWLIGTSLYVADKDANVIKVYSTTNMTLQRQFTVLSPQQITADASGNLWVISNPSWGNASILCYSTAGVQQTSKSITDVPYATSVYFNTSSGQLLVADDGPSQQIIKYNISGATPVRAGTLGEYGGVSAGIPGVVTPTKFDNPMSVAADTSGNIYVGFDGISPKYPSAIGIGFVLRSFSPTQTLNWELRGMEFVDCGVFDPTSDGTVFFTKDEKWAINYDTTSGEMGTWVSRTVDELVYPGDGRVTGSDTNIWMRVINGKKFMFATGQSGGTLNIYQQVDGTELWKLCGAVGVTDVARDLNNDGTLQDGEWQATNAKALYVYSAHGADIDANGNVWFPAYYDGIWKATFLGLDANGAPIYSSTVTKINVSTPFTNIGRMVYIAETDTMYLVGFTAANPNNNWQDERASGSEMIRYNNWSTNPTQAWRTVLVHPATQQEAWNGKVVNSIAVAGNRVFVGIVFDGSCYAYDTTTGQLVSILYRGPEIGGIGGWLDQIQGISATRRSNGEYLIASEDDLLSKVIIYRAGGITPTNFLVTPGATGQVTLSWDNNNTRESGYVIQRSTDGINFTNIATLPSNTTSYSVSGLSTDTRYYFRVKATNSFDDSPWSSLATAYFAVAQAVPTNFTAAPGIGQVSLSWLDNATGETAYKVDRSTSSVFASGVTTFTLAANATSYVDTGLSTTVYYYRVYALNGATSLGYSSPASATPLPAIPAAPTALSAVPAGINKITVKWTDNSSNETGFKLERATNASFTQGLVQVFYSAPNITQYTDEGVTPGVTYFYRVCASNVSGNSAYANTASTRTLNDASAYGIFTNATDIGSTSAAGSTSFANGVYSVAGSGADIGGTNDEFQYVYRSVTGDFSLVTQISSQENTADYAEAGIMVRTSTAANSAYFFAGTRPNTNSFVQWRNSTGSSAEDYGGFIAFLNRFSLLKVTRVGNTLTSYYSTDGTTWTQAGPSKTIALGSSVLVGLAQSSQVDGTLGTSTFSNVAFSAAAAPTGLSLSSTTDSGTIGDNITSYDNSTVANALKFNVTGVLSGATVYLYANGLLIGTGTATGTTVTITTDGLTSLAAGTYAFTAQQLVASRPSSSLTSAVNVTIQPSQTAAPTGITLAAASDTGVAADNLTNLNNSAAGKALSFNVTGTVAGATVFLYADGNLIGQAVATGTTTLVTTNGSTTLTDGSHTFTAKQQSGSAAISNATSGATVTIDTVPPKVSAVLASSSAWAASFLSYLSSNGKGVGGYQISGASQSRTLPWNNINQLKINFSEDVNVIQSSLSLRGTNIANYLTNAFAYSSANKQAVWTLASALGADRLLADLTDGVTDAAGNALDGDWTTGQTVASGNGVAGGHMLFRFNSLPGDTDGNGVILSNDVNAVRLNQFTTASTGGNYSIFNDIDGSGVILSNDVNAVRLLQFTLLPTNQPS